ncbi:MAG TPA: response regulator [Kofleriaceae bacterium]|nr:response regulator [Kofleriaceae bacterium]
MAERFHILHVEDDDLDALNVQRCLCASDAVSGITVASDGVEALQLLRSGRLPLRNLVTLLDIRLPRMSGLEFLRELRADPHLRHLPVVVLSTSDQEEDLGTAYALNVAGYLLKPLSVERLRYCLGAFASYWSAQEMM